VVELDPSIPFTAARARNEGLRQLVERHPIVDLVQFIDGDCELRPGWISEARTYLLTNPDVVAVAGRRRERFPDASLYNLLTDMEWDEPVGDMRSFGGDVMIRVRPLMEIGGYNESLIAGEDPELSLRFRDAGYRLVRIPLEMTLHDANLLRLKQWWQRQARSGHAYVEVVAMQRFRRNAYWFSNLLSIIFWAGVLPCTILVGLWPTEGWSAILLGGYPILWVRTYSHARQARRLPRDARIFAASCVLVKFAAMQGVCTFLLNKVLLRRKTRLIEYKAV